MINCTLYIERNDLGIRERRPLVIAQATIRLDDNPELFDRLQRLGPSLLEGELLVGEYEGRELRTSTDGYGHPLTYLRGRDLRRLVAPREAGAWNKLAVKLLSALPQESVVVLHWD